jgi:hypothetical protein
MNERIRLLAEQAGILIDWGEDIKVGRWGIGGKYENMQKFAELIVKECLNQCYNRGMNDELYNGQLKAAAYIEQHFGVEE